MVVVAESWKLSENLEQQNANSFLEAALNRYSERYRLVEPSVLAFVDEERRAERIRLESEALRNRFAGKAKPALYGIPIGIKDLFHIDGLPTAAGSQLPSSVLTDAEGSLVRRLREQGAWIPGKTVTEEFAFAGSISTRNPHALDRTPGGSSAGSAASVASGMCPVAIGTQTLRSVIAPASFCGVAGFKPSYGRIPLDGVVLLAPSFDTAGIFTADAGSMSLVASHLVPDWQSPLQGRDQIDVERKPVLGIPSGIYMKLMGDEIRSAFETQVASLIQAGYMIRTVEMPWDDDFIYGDAMLRFVQGEMAHVHERWFDEHRDQYGEAVQQAILAGRSIGDDELESYRLGQLGLRNELAEMRRTQGIDLWISPAQGGIAPPHGGRTGWAGMTAVWTYAGLPTISLPGGQAEGLPLGFQCIAEYGQDEILMHHAERIAELL
jgi:Asp-tRNAAsn/Glu-tRNAGln amidotransferase A subunit and related amidases